VQTCHGAPIIRTSEDNSLWCGQNSNKMRWWPLKISAQLVFHHFIPVLLWVWQQWLQLNFHFHWSCTRETTGKCPR
jgi:hypothetical protein